MRLIFIVLTAVVLSGCVTRYHSEIEQARAQQAQAQAAIIQAQQQAQMFATLADASKPVYWPIVVVFVLCMVVVLVVVRWTMITVSHTAVHTPVNDNALRLLPGDVQFYPALRRLARREGAEIELSGSSYYLVMDGQKVQVKSLPGGEG